MIISYKASTIDASYGNNYNFEDRRTLLYITAMTTYTYNNTSNHVKKRPLQEIVLYTYKDKDVVS